MRVAVTGATGHLGSFLTSALCRQGHSVLAIVRPGSDLWRLDESLPRLRVLPVEMRDLHAERGAMEFSPEVMVHLAWAGVTHTVRNSSDAVLANVTNSLALLEFCRSAGCKTWIGVGSQAEYGLYGRPLSEDSPCEPVNLYGASKVAVSHLARSSCKLNGIRFVWFRLYSTYGPLDDPRRLIPSVIEQMLTGNTPPMTGGEQVWDYLYVQDAVDALIEAAHRESISGIFNLGSGIPVLVREAVQMLRDRINPALSLRLGEIPYGVEQPMFLQADIAKWSGVAQWRVRTPLERGLEQTIDWHRKRRQV